MSRFGPFPDVSIRVEYRGRNDYAEQQVTTPEVFHGSVGPGGAITGTFTGGTRVKQVYTGTEHVFLLTLRNDAADRRTIGLSLSDGRAYQVGPLQPRGWKQISVPIQLATTKQIGIVRLTARDDAETVVFDETATWNLHAAWKSQATAGQIFAYYAGWFILGLLGLGVLMIAALIAVFSVIVALVFLLLVGLWGWGVYRKANGRDPLAKPAEPVSPFGDA